MTLIKKMVMNGFKTLSFEESEQRRVELRSKGLVFARGSC